MGIETMLLSIRVAACAVIFIMLATYRPRDARWKVGISTLAACMAGASLAGIMATFMFWQEEAQAWYLPWLTGLSLLLAVRVIRARGNMAVVINIKRRHAHEPH